MFFCVMAVTTSDYGKWRTAEGTLAEVMGQVDSDGRTPEDFVGFEHDGTDYTVVYQLR